MEGGVLSLTPSEESAGKQFAQSATEVCRLIENRAQWSGAAFVRRLLEVLLPLYVSATAIPAVEPGDDEDESSRVSHEEWSALFGALGEHLGSYAHYWEIYDPITLEPDDPVAGNLADDLADIYRDLQDGLQSWQHWEAEKRRNALWQWRFGFESHWGAHAADALRAVHWLLYEHHIEAAESIDGAPPGEDA